MTFTELNAATVALRTTLRSSVSDKALGEVTVRPPAGDEDEASFLRLVAWSYILIFEAGRVAIPFLLQLPDKKTGTTLSPEDSCKLVNELRTWCFHNLGYDSDRDVKISKRVQKWFRSSCGSTFPDNIDSWRKCFRVLCSEVRKIITYCQRATDSVLLGPDDGLETITDLRHRLDRAWSAYKFDELVGDAIVRLGMKVDVVKFRKPHINKWREFLESLPDADDPLAQMVRMIERDLLAHAAQVLPIDGRDIMDALDLTSGPKVGAALYCAHELFRSGIRDRNELLERLKTDINYDKPDLDIVPRHENARNDGGHKTYERSCHR